MKKAFYFVLIAGFISPSFAAQYALTNNITSDIVNVFICATGWMDSLPVPVSPTQEVENIYFYIDSLGPENAIFIAFDFDSATAYENLPMAVAGLRHAFARDVPVFMTAVSSRCQRMIEKGFVYVTDPTQDYYYQTVSWSEWTELREQGIVTKTELVETWEDAGNVLPENALGWVFEGRDYALLGYTWSLNIAILGMIDSIEVVYPLDVNGNILSEMPILQDHKSLREIDLTLTISSSSACNYWVIYAGDKIGLPVAFGVTAIRATDYYPYIQSGQIIGQMGGLRGAAEYEVLLSENRIYPTTDKAFQGMNVISASSMDWGDDWLGEGEIIHVDSTRVFEVGKGNYDIKLIDDHGWLWINSNVGIFGFTESVIYREFLVIPTIRTD